MVTGGIVNVSVLLGGFVNYYCITVAFVGSHRGEKMSILQNFPSTHVPPPPPDVPLQQQAYLLRVHVQPVLRVVCGVLPRREVPPLRQTFLSNRLDRCPHRGHHDRALRDCATVSYSKILPMILI